MKRPPDASAKGGLFFVGEAEKNRKEANEVTGMEEMFDVYDIHRNRTGKILPRTQKREKGEFILVVHLLLFNEKGELLIQKRITDKSTWPDMWDISLGGHAQAGESSMEAVMREAQEELHISLDFSDTAPVFSYRSQRVHNDYWFAQVNTSDVEIRLQPEEVADAKWVNRTEWENMIADRMVIPYSFQNVLFDLYEDNFPGTRTFPFGNPEKIRGALFDMDGLLLDTERVVAESWDKAAAVFHFEDVERAKIACLGVNLAGEREFFRKTYGEDFPFEEFRQYARKLSHDVLDVEVPVKEGAEEILKLLKSLGISLAVASSSRETTVRDELHRAGLLQYFDAVVTGDMVEHSKPHPEIFEKAAAAIGVPVQHCIVFEDSTNGIRSAYRCGAYPIQIPDLMPQNMETKALSWKCFPSLAEAAVYFQKTLKDFE